MTRKFGEARKAAFLAALGETGNQTIAAERAKVSSSWVQLHRSQDEGFRRQVAEAVAAARERLGRRRDAAGGEGGCRPPEKWRFLRGEELVLRGTGSGGGGGAGRRVQIARARLRQWSARTEKRFLATLAATCNVKAACAEVGLTAASAYNHRKRWPVFARQWDAAIDFGHTLLECRLLEAGANLFSDEEPLGPAPLREMTAAQAIHLLHMHKHRARGIGKPPGRMERAPDMDEVRASILRKIAAIKRARALRESQ